MKNSVTKLLLVFRLVAALTSCSNPATHGKFLSDQQDVWMDGYVPSVTGGIDTESDSDKGLVYCRANLQENGIANPICYRARFRVIQDPKAD
jgi:hypothetical protein